MKLIRIANPRTGGALFVSERGARKHIRRKTAFMNHAGELEFFWGHRRDDERREMKIEQISALRRLGKVIFWNGNVRDPVAIHIPGEVRS